MCGYLCDLNYNKNENILEQTAEKGAYFKKKLEFLMAKYPDKVIEIRGCGSFRHGVG